MFLKQMTVDKIKKLLQTVKYPGFDRDIISFGMVNDIIVNQENVEVILSVNSQNDDHKQHIHKQVVDVLSSVDSIQNISVQFKEQDKVKNIHQQNEISPKKISGVKHIIAVASGKGGVGKSTVSINLASSLSKNYKVGLLDLDIYGPSLPMLIDTNETPLVADENTIVPVEKFGMKFMSFGFLNSENSPAIWRGPMVARMTQQFFDNVAWGELDYLILDLPPGTGDIQLTLVQKYELSGAIIVTTPQDLAVLDVAKGADMFNKVNTTVLGVIENMTHFLCPNCNEKIEIFKGKGGEKESERLNVPLLGQVYISPEIALSADKGTPYVIQYEDSPITKIYQNIASKVVDLSNNENIGN
jgi:ATP-binding protein involved in chromosome partitioning